MSLNLWILECASCINSINVELCIDSNTGSISKISTTKGLSLPTSGYSFISDDSYFDVNNVISLDISTNTANQITVLRNIMYNNQYTLTLNDTFSILGDDKSVISWKLTIKNITSSKPFATGISTSINFTNINSSDLYYWTLQSGNYYKDLNTGYKPFVDVLKLLNGTDINNTIYSQIGDDYVDDSIMNNAPNGLTRRVSVFPLSIFTSKSLKHGISFIYDINDIILGATMNINSEHQLFQRYYNRLSPTNTLSFTTYIRLNDGFSWRDTMKWTIDKFSKLFKPSGQPSRVGPIVNNAGLGVYTCAAAMDVNTTNVVNNSGVNINWDSSFWYVYQGMSLPPNTSWSSYLGPEEQGYCGPSFKHGEESTRDRIASHYYNMSKIGITTVSYFNLFEWGEFVKWPLMNIPKNVSNDIWLNSSLYLAMYMNDSVVLDINGNDIHEGPYQGIVLDPGVKSYQNILVNQTTEHIISFGDQFYGLGIDRQDWTTKMNYRRGDNITLCKSKDGKSWIECASLLLSWLEIAEKVSDIVHNQYTKNDAIITTNYQKQRVELLLATDIMFSEQSDLQQLNSYGLSTMAMHCIEWTYNSTEVLVKYGGPHLYFQERLYMNVHSMAPIIGADHSIYPNMTAQKYYNDYNLLFRALRGKSWWLLPETVEIVDNNNPFNPFINSFVDNENENKIVIVAVMGYNQTEAIVNIDINVVGINSEQTNKTLTECMTIYPGQQQWDNGIIVDKQVFTLPLKFGCAVAQCLISM